MRRARSPARAGPRRPAPAGAKLLGQVHRWMVDEDGRRLRDAFETALEQEVIPAYYPQRSAIGEARGLADIETVLRKNVTPFSERYERRGLERCLERRSGTSTGGQPMHASETKTRSGWPRCFAPCRIRACSAKSPTS
ncbi:MAG: hypothetical protein OXH99_09910 [Bryobacterales bacterium]|nr:hypothetical protein [Bryobacterales bacterium]